ncbi:MAG: CZB domain-containing protein [Proteobacteria bacterium]|nr:CZB domain-containing protein [Pseudomonadota bacterium]MBU1739507.1 CZB domain-containing protein [Pseudomonadota bacterium]
MNNKTMNIGQRIALGFGVVLALILALGIITEFGVSGIVGNAAQVIDGNMLDKDLAQKEIDHLNWVAKLNSLLTDDTVTTLSVETDDHQCGFGKWLYGEGRKKAERLAPALTPLFKEIEEPHLKLHQTAISIGKAFKPADVTLPEKLANIESAHLNWSIGIRDAIINSGKSLTVQTDPAKCVLGKWLLADATKAAYANGSKEFRAAFDSIPDTHNEMHHSAIEIGALLQEGNREMAANLFRQKTLPLLAGTLKTLNTLKEEALHAVSGMSEAKRIYAAETLPALSNVQTLLHSIRATARQTVITDEKMLEAAGATRLQSRFFVLSALLVGVLLAFFIGRGIVRVLKNVAGEMGVGAGQVSSAAAEISSTSNSLADGASRQAASLEETSSSLEEMAAMTRQNADSAGQADRLMQEASKVLTESNESMRKLTLSMEEISNASAETQKIVKTIDEIAFQTNLLALNAAVEAARAGEAGAGFAVVADEVRNLAMRAAEAAKTTSNLIENTVKKIDTGSLLVSETSASFNTAMESAGKVKSLVAEISTSSEEQSQGISQVNKAINEIDTVTQNNAANAEESAAASEELNAQAEMMKSLVDELLVLVGSSLNGAEGNAPPGHPHHQVSKHQALPM